MCHGARIETRVCDPNTIEWCFKTTAVGFSSTQTPPIVFTPTIESPLSVISLMSVLSRISKHRTVFPVITYLPEFCNSFLSIHFPFEFFIPCVLALHTFSFPSYHLKKSLPLTLLPSTSDWFSFLVISFTIICYSCLHLLQTFRFFFSQFPLLYFQTITALHLLTPY